MGFRIRFSFLSHIEFFSSFLDFPFSSFPPPRPETMETWHRAISRILSESLYTKLRIKSGVLAKLMTNEQELKSCLQPPSAAGQSRCSAFSMVHGSRSQRQAGLNSEYQVLHDTKTELSLAVTWLYFRILEFYITVRIMEGPLSKLFSDFFP
ncbi:hypothetical protein EJ06DRAFT_234613 [Trichodelitschia bisporula]|uniref:Uncharacterized protein n=1 Tax=Trichodelitschia bisporula TaxID=703511 RepID=A0A6G1HJS7_9PEZI|nr:hypothetical protein EJ06DRAFT_234613 [Trichodelitschia bisporula]